MFGSKPGYSPSHPWLFEPFDQLIFDPVTREEYTSTVKSFNAGSYNLKIEQSIFDMAAYNAHLESIQDELTNIRATQDACELLEMEQYVELTLKFSDHG